jgi:hypothetical protein
MSMPLAAFFKQMEFNYAAGDYAGVAESFVLPGGLYVENDVIVLKDREGLEAMLRDQCRRNRKLGVCRAKSHIVKQSMNRAHNYSVWIRWDHFDANDKYLNSFEARYICCDDTRGVPRIQVIELLSIPACYAAEELRQMSEHKRRLM